MRGTPPPPGPVRGSASPAFIGSTRRTGERTPALRETAAAHFPPDCPAFRETAGQKRNRPGGQPPRRRSVGLRGTPPGRRGASVRLRHRKTDQGASRGAPCPVLSGVGPAGVLAASPAHTTPPPPVKAPGLTGGRARLRRRFAALTGGPVGAGIVALAAGPPPAIQEPRRGPRPGGRERGRPRGTGGPFESMGAPGRGGRRLRAAAGVFGPPGGGLARDCQQGPARRVARRDAGASVGAAGRQGVRVVFPASRGAGNLHPQAWPLDPPDGHALSSAAAGNRGDCSTKAPDFRGLSPQIGTVLTVS